MEILIGFSVIIGIYIVVKATEKIYEYNEENKKAKVILAKQKEIENQERSLKAEEDKLERIKDELEKREKDIRLIAEDNSQNSPWLAERYADYYEMIDKKTQLHLLNKKNPAKKASEIVSEIKKEKKDLLKEKKLLQYQLSFLLYEFPWLEDALLLERSEIEEAIKSVDSDEECKDDYEVVKAYLSPDEYNKLSDAEKYQLALDRYLNKPKKSLWEIGISYERYVGYLYELKNYKVIYNGAREGFGDLGRDIIAENNEEIIIIQCKYWRKERTIRENTIFQLYGTMILKKLETKKKVKGIISTTTSLSDDAKKIAKRLGIEVYENREFDKSYPYIKCNINRGTGEKIYHLPFDQQYDRIQIQQNKGECYVSTVKEAEKLGFRRAKKHFFIK